MPCTIETGLFIRIIIGMTLSATNELSERFVRLLMMAILAGNPYGMETVREFYCIHPGVKLRIVFWPIQYNVVRYFIRQRDRYKYGENH